MGQGMAVCSLGTTQTVLHCCLGPALPLWGPDLVDGASLGSGTLLPSGHGAENLRGPSWSLTHNSNFSCPSQVWSLSSGHRDLLFPLTQRFLLLPANASFGLVVAVAMAMNLVQPTKLIFHVPILLALHSETNCCSESLVQQPR